MPEMLTIKGMHVGEQFIHSDEDLAFCRQMGVEYVGAYFPTGPGSGELGLEKEGYWNTDALVRFREHVESFGLKLAAIHLPLKSLGMSDDIKERRWPSIILGGSKRDRDIEQVCKCIKAAGKAGIPILTYDLTALPVLRNPERTKGRGGVTYSYFNYEKMEDAPMHPAGPISAEEAWERIEYFLKRVTPVAEEYKVKMACHPHDMSVPPGTTYRGIVPVLSNVDGLKRFIDLCPSPYHGISFCQGCIVEFSISPEQVYDVIRYFGSRKKIFWVHFRNIRGGFLNFEETFPDDGDIDMVKAMRTYKKVGYNGVLIPDHVPRSYLDTPWGHRAHAFCLGYMKALIQAVESKG